VDLLSADWRLLCIECAFAVSLVLSFVALWGSQNRKTVLIGTFAVTDLVCSWVWRVLRISLDWVSFTILPMTLHAAPAMTAGSFLLFLLQPDSGGEYRPITDLKETFLEDESTSIDET
jgi:hypothetical protein